MSGLRKGKENADTRKCFIFIEFKNFVLCKKLSSCEITQTKNQNLLTLNLKRGSNTHTHIFIIFGYKLPPDLITAIKYTKKKHLTTDTDQCRDSYLNEMFTTPKLLWHVNVNGDEKIKINGDVIW